MAENSLSVIERPALPAALSLPGTRARDALELYAERLSPNSVRNYKRAFDLFEKTTGATVQSATMHDVSHFIGWMEREGYANKTQNLYLAGISGLMERHLACGTRTDNAVRGLNKIKRISKPVDKQAHFNVELDDFFKIKKTDLTGLIIRALFYTACRISELLSIRLADIQDGSENGTAFKSIKILGKGKKERTVNLPADLFDEIRKAFAVPGSEYLFHATKGRRPGGPLNRTNLYRQVKSKFRKYTGKHVSPHQIRHFFATDKIITEKQSVAAVSKYLGHSSTSITNDIYVHARLAPLLVMSRRI